MSQGLKTKMSFRNGFPKRISEQERDSDLESWRGKARKLCVAVERMLFGSSDVGAVLRLWRDTSSNFCLIRAARVRKEQKRRELGKKIGMMREWPVGGMRVLRLALLWILLKVSDAIGGSFGGENPSTPRNGARARNSSRSLRETEKQRTKKWDKVLAGKKDKAGTARVRTQGPSKKIARVGTRAHVRKTARVRTQESLKETARERAQNLSRKRP